MRDLVTFFLSVKYRAPSKEKLFLEKGWGIRDVSGPYLSISQVFICIDNSMFSSEIPSTISLVFSVSNRCPTASVLVTISNHEREFSQHIKKNGSSEFIIESVYFGPQRRYVISVCLPEVENLANPGSFSDILAIDEISIER